MFYNHILLFVVTPDPYFFPLEGYMACGGRKPIFGPPFSHIYNEHHLRFDIVVVFSCWNSRLVEDNIQSSSQAYTGKIMGKFRGNNLHFSQNFGTIFVFILVKMDHYFPILTPPPKNTMIFPSVQTSQSSLDGVCVWCKKVWKGVWEQRQLHWGKRKDFFSFSKFSQYFLQLGPTKKKKLLLVILSLKSGDKNDRFCIIK